MTHGSDSTLPETATLPGTLTGVGDVWGRRVTVLVADDHPMWRDAVARDLRDAGYDVVATADDGHTAVDRTVALRPDVLILDLNLPGRHGVEVARLVSEADLPTHILILSASAEQIDVLNAVKHGATGYLLKSAGREDFLDAVRATAEGRAVFTPGLAGLVLGEFRRMAAAGAAGGQHVPELTPREREVLKFVAMGMTAKQIGEVLFVSHRTVSNHVQSILGKLQLHNRVELARYALANGLGTDDDPRAEPQTGPPRA